MKIIGIYKITSPSGKIYIGQSIDIISRWATHKKAQVDSSTILYNSIKKYGADSHKFEVLCQCDIAELNNLEKYYIDLFQTFNSKHGMNIRDGGGSFGKHSEITKAKISKSHIGIKHSDKTKEKIRQITTGKKQSAETIEKRVSKFRGKPSKVRGQTWKWSEESKKNLVDVCKKRDKNQYKKTWETRRLLYGENGTR